MEFEHCCCPQSIITSRQRLIKRERLPSSIIELNRLFLLLFCRCRHLCPRAANFSAFKHHHVSTEAKNR